MFGWLFLLKNLLQFESRKRSPTSRKWPNFGWPVTRGIFDYKCIHPSEHVYLVFQHVLVLCNAIGTPLDSKYIEIGKQLAWENRRNFATPSVVFPRNNIWEMSAEIPYWWRVTTQIWIVLLIGRAAWESSTNQKHYPDLGSDASSVWNLCAHFSDVISRGNHRWRREMSSVFSG